MTKPTINSFSSIAPLIVQQYERYLPSAFDDSLSMLEKIDKIIEYCNQIGVLSDNVVEQWNTVMEYVMGEGLTDVVETKLNDMLSNGVFDTLINETILGSKAKIIVSSTEPIPKDKETFWYDDVGETPINFSQSNNNNDGAIVASNVEPLNKTATWYDTTL